MTKPSDGLDAQPPDLEGLARLEDAHSAFVRVYSKVHREADSRVLLRATVDAHCRRGLRLLRREYAHTSTASVDEPELRSWLKKRADELEEFESTFDRRWVPRAASGRMLSVLPGVEIMAGIVGLSGLSSVGALVSGTCLCKVLWFVPLAVTLGIFLLGFSSFDDKRELFVKARVYQAEDDVYRVLGSTKRREPSLWGLGCLVIAAIWFVAALLETTAIKNHLFINPNHNVYWLFFAVAVAAALIIFAVTRKREPA
jgi:hypothetical protein